jgi:hypothetical protein
MTVGLCILNFEFGRGERFSFWVTWVGLIGVIGLVGGGRVLVTELLDFHKLARNAAKRVGDADVVVEAGVRVGGLGMSGQEELAEMSGGDLEAGGGQINVVVVGEDVEDGLFANAVGGKAFLVQEPVLVATLVPVGDVARGNGVAELSQGGDDLFVGDTVFEHVVDEVPVGFGEGGDFAVTTTSRVRSGFGLV